MCTAELDELLRGGHTGVVAMTRRRTLGVMTGKASRTDAWLPVQGFALAPAVDDPTPTLARLYAELAPELVAGGALRDVLEHVALQPLSEAVSNLGFGRHVAYAARSPAARSGSTDVRVRAAGDDELDLVTRLVEVEIRHRAAPPIYGPPDPRSSDEIRDRIRAIRGRGGVHFVAALEGRDVRAACRERCEAAPEAGLAGREATPARGVRTASRGRRRRPPRGSAAH